MVKVISGDREFYLDGYLKSNLDLYKKMVKANRDLIFVVSGREGEGKSVCAAGILKYLDPTFNLDRCYMTGDEFIKALIDNKEPFKAYQFDESQEFTSRAAMTRFNKLLVQVLSKIRAKQLYIGLCIPSFFELDKYPAIHRSSFLINVYSEKGARGRFRFWNWERKKLLYLYGKKSYDYNAAKHNFIGVFTKNMFPFNQDEYDKKKLDSINAIEVETNTKQQKLFAQRNELIKYLADVVGLKRIEVSEILSKGGCPLNISSIGEAMREKKEDVAAAL